MLPGIACKTPVFGYRHHALGAFGPQRHGVLGVLLLNGPQLVSIQADRRAASLRLGQAIEEARRRAHGVHGRHPLLQALQRLRPHLPVLLAQL
ncbi:hypothetical protein D3C72_1966360 [compost metagenome]